METTDLLTLLNQGDREALLRLPGIGPALAERIEAARPFDSLEDCADRVRGLSLKRLEALSEQLAEQAAAAADKRAAYAAVANWETFKTRAADRLDSAAQRGRAAWSRLETHWQTHADEPITLRGLVWSLALALLLTLALVRVGNFRLERRLQNETARYAYQVTQLQQEVEALRQRVQAAEAIGQRTAALEAEQTALQTEQETLQAELDALQTRLDEIEVSLETQARTTQRFSDFLQSLQQLLNALFAAPGDSQ